MKRIRDKKMIPVLVLKTLYYYYLGSLPCLFKIWLKPYNNGTFSFTILFVDKKMEIPAFVDTANACV